MRIRLGVLAFLLLFVALGGPAVAHDGTTADPTGISGGDFIISPSGGSDDAFNGYRIFLSSPRHADSGSRGECMNPGRQENVNGRYWNWYAANGNSVGAYYDTTNRSRNLHSRGYSVRVSKNAKDNGYLENSQTSANWGSHIHVVTHTNASPSGGCGAAGDYLLTIWNNANDHQLADIFRPNLNSYIPGSTTNWQDPNLAELNTNRPLGDVYIELQFHTNQARQQWLYNNSDKYSYLYGLSVDQYLGYP